MTEHKELPAELFCKCKNGKPCSDTMFEIQQWHARAIQEVEKAGEQRGAVNMAAYLATYRWSSISEGWAMRENQPITLVDLAKYQLRFFDEESLSQPEGVAPPEKES